MNTYKRTGVIRTACVQALDAIGEPATWPEINDWCWDNVRRWCKWCPTKSQIGSILDTDHRVVKLGYTNLQQFTGQTCKYTIWALKEWGY